MTDDTRAMTQQEMCLHLGAVLREARLEAGLTQDEVARGVGMALELYTRVEKGRMMPDLLGLRALCSVLELDSHVALGLVAPEAPSAEGSSDTASEDPPRLRQLVHTLRRLDSKQLELLTTVALSYLPPRPR